MWDERALARMRRAERRRECWHALARHLPWIAAATLIWVIIAFLAGRAWGAPTATPTATGCLPPNANGVVFCITADDAPPLPTETPR